MENICYTIKNKLKLLAILKVTYSKCMFCFQITVQQWRLVFWITTAIAVVSRILFMFGASGEVQPWNNPSDMADDIEKKSKKGRQYFNDFLHYNYKF